MHNRLGYIISKIYNGVTSCKEIEYEYGSYQLKLIIDIMNGIICFDERKTHVVNLKQILKHYYQLDHDVMYHELGSFKETRNALDGKEMFFANLLAGIGEITCLFGDSQSKNGGGKIISTMLFLPQDLSEVCLFQKQQVVQLWKKRGSEHFEIALCNGNSEEVKFCTDTKILAEWEKECEKKITSIKYRR